MLMIPTRRMDFHDEFGAVLPSASINNSVCTSETGLTLPSSIGGTRTATDTETCMSIIPNFGTALADQTGVTFGGSNNRCSYADGYAWMDFPVGFTASAHAGLGRIVVMYDGNGRCAWGFLGTAGSGETLSDEKLLDPSFDDTTKWSKSDGSTVSGGVADLLTAGYIYQFPVISIGSLYKGSMTKSSGTSGVSLYLTYSSFIITTTNGSATGYLVATGVPSDSWCALFCYYVDHQIFSDISLKQVLTPSATGCLVYRDAACTVNGWHKPAAFDMKASAYTFGIYQPTAGGRLFFQGGKATPALGDPGLWRATAITRIAGLIGCFKITPKDVTNSTAVGFDTNTSGALEGNAIRINADTIFCKDGTTEYPAVLVPADGTIYYLAVILRAAGAMFFVKSGTGNWRLFWSTTGNNTGTLYIGESAYSITGFKHFVRLPKTRWLPTPLLSDGFSGSGSNDGRTADGLGHAETTGLGSGGLAVWSGAGGAVGSGVLVITPSASASMTNGNFEGGFTAGLGNSWTKAVTAYVTASDETTIVHGGSHSQKVVVSVASNGIYNEVNSSLPAGTWVKISGYVYADGTGSFYFMNANYTLTTFPVYDMSFSVGGWRFISFNGRMTTTGMFGVFFRVETTGINTYVDDVNATVFNTSSLFSTILLTSPDCEIKCLMSRTQTGIQQGIVFGLDSKTNPQNFGLVYFDGNGNIVFEVCVAGTYSSKLINVATTFTNAYEFRVWQAVNPATGFREVHVYYNNVLIGSFVTLTAPQTTATNGLYAGLFSTAGADDTFDWNDFYGGDFTVSGLVAWFDNATIYDVGTGGAYNILNNLIGA